LTKNEVFDYARIAEELTRFKYEIQYQIAKFSQMFYTKHLERRKLKKKVSLVPDDQFPSLQGNALPE